MRKAKQPPKSDGGSVGVLGRYDDAIAALIRSDEGGAPADLDELVARRDALLKQASAAREPSAHAV